MSVIEKKDVPRTMENIFADGKCDNCGSNFGRRTEIWVWCEHTCCSKTCVVAAKRKGDDQAHDAEVRDGSLL